MKGFHAAAVFGMLLLEAAALPPRPVEAATFMVTVAPGGSLVFNPSSQTITVGDTVQWEWGLGTHSSTSGTICVSDNNWDSALQANPFTFSHTFNTPGTFSYFCVLHCRLGMTGEIVVQTPTPAPTATPAAEPSSSPTPPGAT